MNRYLLLWWIEWDLRLLLKAINVIAKMSILFPFICTSLYIIIHQCKENKNCSTNLFYHSSEVFLSLTSYTIGILVVVFLVYISVAAIDHVVYNSFQVNKTLRDVPLLRERVTLIYDATLLFLPSFWKFMLIHTMTNIYIFLLFHSEYNQFHMFQRRRWVLCIKIPKIKFK